MDSSPAVDDPFERALGTRRGRPDGTAEGVIALFCAGQTGHIPRLEVLRVSDSCHTLELDLRVIAVRRREPDGRALYWVKESVSARLRGALRAALGAGDDQLPWCEASDGLMRAVIDAALAAASR